jgi:1-acyl-sn-glycerol-3-phosphate acyltransferase
MIPAAGALRRYGLGLPISHLPPTHLVDRGPYCFTRHPIYLGYFLTFLGIAVILRSTPMLVISLPVLLAGIGIYTIIEEKSLLRRHGETFRRYRREVPPLIPGALFFLYLPLRALAAILFKLRVSITRAPMPRGSVLMAPHTDYFDPVFLFLAMKRPIHFLVTHDMYRSPLLSRVFGLLGSIRIDRYKANPAALLRTRRLVERGCMVGVFPSGGRSWYGEGAHTLELESFLIRSTIPVVPARIPGSYQAYPRWNGVRRRAVRVEILEPVVIRRRGDLSAFLQDLWSPTFDPPRGRRHRRYAKAVGIEKILYYCPGCGALHALRVDGEWISCRYCDTSYRLRADFRLERPSGSLLSLPDYHAAVLPQIAALDEIRAAVHWSVERGYRRDDTVMGPSILHASAAGVRVVADDGTRRKLPIGSIDAVLIRSNRYLQLYALRTLHTFHFFLGSAPLFQDYIRLHAFGNPAQRRRHQRVMQIVPQLNAPGPPSE